MSLVSASMFLENAIAVRQGAPWMRCWAAYRSLPNAQKSLSNDMPPLDETTELW